MKLIRNLKNAHNTLVQVKIDDRVQANSEDVKNSIRQRKEQYDSLVSGLADIGNQVDSIAESHRELIRKWLGDLKIDILPLNLREAIRREKIYARLKVILDHKDDPQNRNKLIDKFTETKDLEKLFDLADSWAWDKIKTSDIKFRKPTDNSEFEAYQLINFEIESASANDTYLFKHGLTYKWKISYTPIGESKPHDLEPISEEPRVTQYVPYQCGTITATAQVKFPKQNEKLTNPPTVKFTTGESTDFKLNRSFRHLERSALGVAFLFTIITGTQSEQFQSALKGSGSSYLALFAWGIAVDQTKNLLEYFRSLTGQEKQT